MMKRLIMPLLCICLCAALMLSAASADGMTDVTKVRTGERGASLRSSPEVTDYNKIRGIHAGTDLDVYDYVNGWYYVRYRDEYGYVISNMVTVIERGERYAPTVDPYRTPNPYPTYYNPPRPTAAPDPYYNPYYTTYASYPEYIVESYEPNGYCYQYDKPSSINGTNLGRHNNGETVKVISYDYSSGYDYVVCTNGKLGYIHDSLLTPYTDTLNREQYRVYSTDPAGYCYMYTKPSSINGSNLGRYDNGEIVEIVDWYADDNYAKVRSPRTQKYGYIGKRSLVPADSYKPYEGYAYVNSTEPMGYCYLYDRPSSTYGSNLGRHNNGELIYILDWYADTNYAQVECASDGRIGYIRKACLQRQ